ncbi:BnaC09g14820D [Brassica napus]|uniref:Uncharacterized protein n=2 Tax=Brassica TaxID=3705 RepID=A0A3P6EEI9_BRAOL|nr:unnamed protein product [Brassica napus]CDY47233.1 BnaC09g14820D [Brassica napus]VDD29779.1 unnamed protein product [Brassica oleracea]
MARLMLAFWPRRSMARALRNPPSPRRYMAMEPSPKCASRHGAKGERHFKHRFKEIDLSFGFACCTVEMMRTGDARYGSD